MARMLALLGLIGLSQAAIVMVGDVAFDTAKMADKINANLDQCKLRSSTDCLRH
jgi:hypothetical protein